MKIDHIPRQHHQRTPAVQLIAQMLQRIGSQRRLSFGHAVVHPVNLLHLCACQQQLLCNAVGVHRDRRMLKAAGIGHQPCVQAICHPFVQAAQFGEQVGHQLAGGSSGRTQQQALCIAGVGRMVVDAQVHPVGI